MCPEIRRWVEAMEARLTAEDVLVGVFVGVFVGMFMGVKLWGKLKSGKHGNVPIVPGGSLILPSQGLFASAT